MKTNFLLTVLIFTFLTTSAQIVYTDVSVTLNGPSGTHSMDFNADGIMDFNISITSFAAYDTLCYSITIISYNDNLVTSFNSPDKSWAPCHYPANTTFDETFDWRNFSHGGTMALGHYCTSWYFGCFQGAIDRYIGVKFTDTHGSYYGWIRVDVSPDSDWITIKDIAYNSNGNPITSSPFANSNLQGTNSVCFDIYPNPAKDIINIVSTSDIFTVEIYNILGQKMLSEENKNSLNISKFQSGTYFIKISQKGQDTYKKFVVY